MFPQYTARRDFLFIVFASVSWGTVGVANQALYGYGATNALSLTFLRLAIAAPLFFLASWMFLGRRFFQIKRRDLGTMMLMGSMLALSQACYVAAIASAGVSVSTLIAICAAPVIIILLSALFTRERLTPMTLIALFAALGGTALPVTTRSHDDGGTVSLSGVLFAFLSACGYAGFIFCGRLTVRNVIKGFNAAGLAVLHEGSSRPHRLRTAFTQEGAERLKDLLHRTPRDFGQDRSAWTLELAAQVSFEQGIISCEVSDESVRRALKRLKTNWKRAKHWITSPDPLYLKKTARDRLIAWASAQPEWAIGFLDARLGEPLCPAPHARLAK